MSERMTSIYLPGCDDPGFADWGRKTVSEMVAMIRNRAALQKRRAEEILAATDADFNVETYLGPIVRRNREILQKGRSV